MVDHQGGVLRLVAGEREFLGALLELGLRQGEVGVGLLDLGAAHQVFLALAGVAVVLLLGQRQALAGGVQPGRGGGAARQHVGRVELGEHIAPVHQVPEVGVTGDDLAVDAEAERGLEARPHLAGVALVGAVGRPAHRRCKHLLRRRGRRRRRRACGQQERGRQEGLGDKSRPHAARRQRLDHWISPAGRAARQAAHVRENLTNHRLVVND